MKIEFVLHRKYLIAFFHDLYQYELNYRCTFIVFVEVIIMICDYLRQFTT